MKSRLEAIAGKGVIIVHATNRMADLVLEDVGTLLAHADYITCSSSTRILKCDRATGKAEDDPDYDDLVAGCNFSPEACREQAARFEELSLTAEINQTPRKVSYTFRPGTPLERRHEIHQALRCMQPEGIDVFMVEDRDNHIIDFLPEYCTKQKVLEFILSKEGVDPAHVIAFGNSNNDIPLLRGDFTCVAVGDSRDSLKNHVNALRQINPGTERHVIAPRPSTEGVLWGLDQFNL